MGDKVIRNKTKTWHSTKDVLDILNVRIVAEDGNPATRGLLGANTRSKSARGATTNGLGPTGRKNSNEIARTTCEDYSTRPTSVKCVKNTTETAKHWIIHKSTPHIFFSYCQ